MIRFSFLALLVAGPSHADIVVASRIIPANAIISIDDIHLKETSASGAITDTADVVGMEARKALFAGRPILSGDVGVPAVVERNQVVQLVFDRHGLVIKTDGRALDRAGPGDTIRVMNLSSRTTVAARVDDLGIAHVIN